VAERHPVSRCQWAGPAIDSRTRVVERRGGVKRRRRKTLRQGAASQTITIHRRQGRTLSNRRTLAASIAIIACAGILTTACQPSDVYNLPRARSGAKCTSPGSFARDTTNVLQCSPKRRWAVNMPISRAVTLINAYNRSITPTEIVRLGAPQIVIAGSGAADAVVIVKNADGAPVKDALVQFTQSGTTSLNWASATESRTGADGKASVTFTPSTSVGVTYVTASVPGTGLSAIYSIETRAAEPATFTITGSTLVRMNLRSSVTLKARLTDRFGNPVWNEPVDVLTDSEDFSFQPTSYGTQPDRTDGYGEYSGVLSSSAVAGQFGVAFVAGPDDREVAVTWDVDVLPGAAYSVHLTSSSLTAPVNTPLPGPIVVTVSDSDGNPVPGIPVTFDIATDTSSATGSFGATSGVTDALGHVTTTFTCGATAGIAYVGAHAAGINGYGPITCT